MDEKKHKILKQEDFIDYPKFKNSIKKLIEKYPNGVDEETICKVLNISKEEYQKEWKTLISTVRDKIK